MTTPVFNIEKEEPAAVLEPREALDIDKNKKKRRWSSFRQTCPLGCIIIFALTVVAAICHLMFYFSDRFADAFNMSVSAFFRSLLAFVSGFFPFSLAETVILMLPVFIVMLPVYCIKTITRGSNEKGTRLIFLLLSVLCLLYSLFVAVFAPAYRGRPLDEKLGYQRAEVTKEELYQAAVFFEEKAKSELDDIEFTFGGGSDMPYTHRELIHKLNDAYAEVSAQYEFVQQMRSHVKFVALSELMTYTHISGVYTFYTGEANININFPDYTLPYTAAHEMSHQRGIAAENEANFMAFLVCQASDDPYIRYSGYMNIYEYLINALYTADKTLYNKVWSESDSRIKYEETAYSNFYKKYSKSTASVVTNAINDAYLKTQGQSAGTKSYGLVVDLAVAYVKNQNDNAPVA